MNRREPEDEGLIVVVIPALDEGPNLEVLIPEVLEALSSTGLAGRVVVIDDGSTDHTGEVLAELMSAYPMVGARRFTRNRGKAAALQVGFEYALQAGATIVVMMDADGQDDPAEIPRLVEQLNAGSDLVTGARVIRQDRLVKRSTSRFFNRVTCLVAGVAGSDFNSGYKALSAECAAAVSPLMYGELHRYVTVIAHWTGFRTSEIPVCHRSRMYGTTKYGISRFWRGFFDLLTVRFLMTYQHRPGHLFGGAGVLSAALGSVALVYLISEWARGMPIGGRPLLIAGVLLIIVGIQLLLFGLLAELVVFSRLTSRLPTSFRAADSRLPRAQPDGSVARGD